MFEKFWKEVRNCFCPSKCMSFFLGLFFAVGMYYACQVCFASSNALPDYHKLPKVSLTKLDSISMGRADSIIAMYDEANKLAERVEKLANNYQGDSNLMIEKADQMVAKWLAISTALVALIIGLSVWNNYKQESSIKESVERETRSIVKIKQDLELSTRMNKISSIMTCLNSLPDPLMTDSDTSRKTYVRRNLDMMYDEFVAYKKVMESADADNQDLQYVQLILSVIKIAILRVQGVFSDSSSNLCFFSFTKKLDDCIFGIQSGDITHSNLCEKLCDIHQEFDAFKAGVM